MSQKILVLLVVVMVLSVLTTTIQAQDTRGERQLAIDVQAASGEEYDDAFIMAREIGMQTLTLSLDWENLEPAPQAYDGTWLEIANIYYPAYDTPLNLVIRPIHTGTLRVPADLQNVAFDDPIMIARFQQLLDFVFSTTPDLTINSLVIGSEIDGYLGEDARRWEAYTTFAATVADYAREHHPNIKIAFEVMFPSFINPNVVPYLQTLNTYSDVVGVSYYPLQDDFIVKVPTVVHDDFAALVALFPDKPIYFYQLGYPSSEQLNSSEDLQAQFVTEVFEAWDTHQDAIGMIQFTWLTDQSADAVAGFEAYYDFSSPNFSAFLGSLGLRYEDGTPKTALQTLTEAASARGW